MEYRAHSVSLRPADGEVPTTHTANHLAGDSKGGLQSQGEVTKGSGLDMVSHSDFSHHISISWPQGGSISSDKKIGSYGSGAEKQQLRKQRDREYSMGGEGCLNEKEGKESGHWETEK